MSMIYLSMCLSEILSRKNDVPLSLSLDKNIGLEGVKQDAKFNCRYYEGSNSYGSS